MTVRPVHRGGEQPLFPLSRDSSRWLEALDALAPYLIALIAIAIARHSSASSVTAIVAAVVAVALLGTGTAALFFRDLSDAHLAWPVAFVLCVALVPLIALHCQFESIALGAPVVINLLPLAFTWTGLLIVCCLVTGMICMMSAEHPGWASAIMCPIAVLLGTAPLLSLDPSLPNVLTTLLYCVALAEIVAGVAWLLPEHRRWFVVPVVLILAAVVIGHAFLGTPHHLPGRALVLIDAALAMVAGLAALAAPLACRWLAPSGRSENASGS